MRGRNLAEPQYPRDDGSADPRAVAALAAYRAGQGSEHAALLALAASRLLVPVVARPADGEHWAEMALPTVAGKDGRHALLGFTCAGSLARWRTDARPVPVPAGRLWQAGAQETGAVVIDIAGPVPLAVEGARLAALAAGRPPPLPHEDLDLEGAAAQVAAGEPALVGCRLRLAEGDSDVRLEFTLAPGYPPGQAAAQQVIERAVTGIMAVAGGRLRRGIEVVATTADGPP